MRTILLAVSVTMATQSAFAFDGAYTNRRAPGKAVLNIKKVGDDRFSVSDIIAWRNGCGGQFKATGRASGNRLVAAKKTDDETCTLTIVRVADGLSVEESGCFYQHGASCEFSGVYSPSQ